MTFAPALHYADFRSLRFSSGGHLLTRVLSQRLGAWLAWMAFRAGLAPSTVTLLGLGLFLLGSILYASLAPTTGAVIACLALFQLAYALDCADGQLARATATTSTLGAWLDVACDHVRTVALAASAGLWLGRCGMSPGVASVCAAVFLAGGAVNIYTFTMLRSSVAQPPARMTGAALWVREAVTLSCDTTGILLLIAVLRGSPRLLAAYLAGAGAVLLVVSVYLALRRLRPGTGRAPIPADPSRAQ